MGMAPALYAGPAGMRRHSGPQHASSAFMNGEAMHKSNSGSGIERARKMGGAVEGLKRETISHAA